ARVELANESTDRSVSRRARDKLSIDGKHVRRFQLVEDQIFELAAERVEGRRRILRRQRRSFGSQPPFEMLGDGIDEILLGLKVVVQGGAVDPYRCRNVPRPKPFESLLCEGLERCLDDESATLVRLQSDAGLRFLAAPV